MRGIPPLPPQGSLPKRQWQTLSLAHRNAVAAIQKAEAIENEARAWRRTAQQASAHYEGLYEEALGPALEFDIPDTPEGIESPGGPEIA